MMHSVSDKTHEIMLNDEQRTQFLNFVDGYKVDHKLLSTPMGYVIFVPNRESGKVIGWVSSNGLEEEITFNKDFYSKFSYATKDEADIVVKAIGNEFGFDDAVVLGSME